MAHEKVDLAGHEAMHQDYHALHGTPCNHDCLYYEEIGNEVCGACHLPWNMHPWDLCENKKPAT